ncbi:MAG: DEAD/DEAH box helicase [Micropepsaceae bacterium]
MFIAEIPEDELDPITRAALKSWGLESLTQIQLLALRAGIAKCASQVVCAPTSSGKTLVGEIAILSAISRGWNCLYLVSHKALADQKYSDFQSRFGEHADDPVASVGLSTGDRDEGEVTPRLLVATYEKALALLMSGQITAAGLAVIADELQIINETSRGPNIETLCTILKQRGVEQFVALTATIGNAQDLADWLNCELVCCNNRDVDLNQEIWSDGEGYLVKFGQETGAPCHAGQQIPTDPIEVVRHLVSINRGPVLVFTESRQEASEYAERYSLTLARTADGIVVAEQLELFSEPTESSQQLQRNAQRRVAFHTADLTAQERQVIEKGFSQAAFDVCFATSTLAAGVNFPFRSVVFPKLTYQYGERQGHMIVRSDYRNMSGRAGRLGYHSDGYAVLLPRNTRELRHANHLVLPENDNVDSKFVSVSMRRTVLSLIASQVVTTRDNMTDFFQNTLYWHQIRERNPKMLEDVVASAIGSVDWLIASELIEADGDYLMPTPVGKAIAQSGLLPSTAVSFLKMMHVNLAAIESEFERHITGLIHWVCQSDEFRGETPSRFLPFPSRGVSHSTGFVQSQLLLAPLNRTDDRVNQCAHAVMLFSQGDAERVIRQQTNISSGQLHRLAIDVAWVFNGLRRIASVPEIHFPQTLTNKLSMLARQVQWGAPAEALDILRVAQREGVPGFGRQRAVALLRSGIQTFDQLLSHAKDVLLTVLGNDRRTNALLSAVASCVGFGPGRYQQVHSDMAALIDLSDLVSACEASIGTAYEAAIKTLLEVEKSWTVHALDDGRQKNVPDLMIKSDRVAVLVECKTTTKTPPLIKKEEAFAVLQKSIDYDSSMPRVTLGKPSFDEHSKKKAQAAKDISLIEHAAFMEGILRLHAKEISTTEFVNWLSAPGVAELDRLGGRPIYQIVREGL